MTNLIEKINELMQPALELGFDWPSTELNGYIDPINLSTEERIEFLNELELFVGRSRGIWRFSGN